MTIMPNLQNASIRQTPNFDLLKKDIVHFKVYSEKINNIEQQVSGQINRMDEFLVKMKKFIKDNNRAARKHS